MLYPTGIGTAIANNTQARLYSQTMRSDWTVEQLWHWVKVQPLYSAMPENVFYAIVGWTQGEGYWGQSLYGSYLCGCCGVNNYIHRTNTSTTYSVDDFLTDMHLQGISYYSAENMINRGKNCSTDALKSITLSLANPHPQMTLFYSELDWSDTNPPPYNYINYSPVCYDYNFDPPIKIWAIVSTAWSITTTGSGVRSWTEQDVPTPSPTPTKRRKMPLMFYLKRKIRIK